MGGGAIVDDRIARHPVRRVAFAGPPFEKAFLLSAGTEATEAALKLIAASARGSMRDALSLVDQGIAYCAGHVTEAAVRAMLGAVDRGFLFEIAEALARGDAASALAVADRMESLNISFDSALQELASLYHRLALAQSAPESIAEDDPDRARFLELSARFDAEELQLNYQIAIHGRQDLPYAPDSYAGFTMALLRMAAFRPSGAGESQPIVPAASKPAARGGAAIAGQPATAAGPGLENWAEMASSLKLGGIARQLAQQSALTGFADGVVELRIAPAFRHLAEKAYQEKLRLALEQHLGKPVRLKVLVGDTGGSSAQDRAVEAISRDKFVRGLMDEFDATIVDSSIKPAR